MERRAFIVSALGGIVCAARGARVAAQARPMAADLAGLAERKQLAFDNRTVTPLTDGARRGVRVSAAPGEDMAFLPAVTFGNGTIEFDVRGKNVPQQSFVGVTFHGVDRRTHDVVYFRPFNFQATDPVSRGHAVQYHSAPDFGWQRLRTDHPGMYEQAVNPVPDPNAWFHARIVVAHPRVSVFVGDGTAPCLSVDMLSNRKTGQVGLWVGNNSGGDFANLTLMPTSA